MADRIARDRVRAPSTAKHLERLEQMVRGEVPAPPIATLIGFALVEVGPGRSTTEMDADRKHANPMGTLHGGVVCDLADAAMGMAMATTLEDDESFTTLDLTAKYFKPVWNARLRAEASVTKRTRTLGLVECDVLDATGSLVAKVFSTCMVLRGAEAKGR
jgi:uncharacterized protein (TIGR00369 family)